MLNQGVQVFATEGAPSEATPSSCMEECNDNVDCNSFAYCYEVAGEIGYDGSSSPVDWSGCWGHSKVVSPNEDVDPPSTDKELILNRHCKTFYKLESGCPPAPP